MPRITSLNELNRLKVELVIRRNQEAARGIVHVSVGMGTCGIAAGASEVFCALEEAIQARQLKGVILSETGCLGLCDHEPTMDVLIGTQPKVSYGKVTPAIAVRILQEHIIEGKVVEDFVIDTTPFPTM